MICRRHHFSLSGSGWAEGTLFPWTVSDFSLIDAIECGIVKLPRVPVADNIPGADVPNLSDFVGAHWQGYAEEGKADRRSAVATRHAQNRACMHCISTTKKRTRNGAGPESRHRRCSSSFATTQRPQSSYTSGYQGWQRPNEDGEEIFEHNGHLELFRNFDEHGNAASLSRTRS